jgi:hypothetical protein
MSQPSPQWHFRQQDGLVLGPVDLETLRLWSRQARVGPGTGVSSDGVHWAAPESVAALELDWLVDLPDGRQFGPVHKSAVAELLRMQMIPATAVALHAQSKTRSPVTELTAPAKPPATVLLEVENRRLQAELGQARANGETVSRELETLRGRVEELSAEVARLTATPLAAAPSTARNSQPRAAAQLIIPPTAAKRGSTRSYFRVCPKCGHQFATRTNRPLWMRLIPGSRLLICDRCGARYMIVARKDRQDAPGPEQEPAEPDQPAT